MHLSRFLWLGLLMVMASVAVAEVPVPALHSRVTDLTATLSAADCQRFETLLQEFETKKGAQLAVLIVPTTAPETIEQYGIRVAGQWKLGRKGVDDGALLLIAKQDRTVRIEVGYGLEGALPDATAKRIVEEIIVPAFKQGDFTGGIDAGLRRMIGVIEGEPLPAPAPKAWSHPGELGDLVPFLFVGIPIVGLVLRAIIGRLPAGLLGGGAMGTLIWFLLGSLVPALFCGVLACGFILMGQSRRGGYGGGWGGGLGGGGWSGGGSSGGGFSGGGGSFGGGGASGGW